MGHLRASDLTGWFKSSYSNDQGGACVEGARLSGKAMAVRDSKVPNGPAFRASSEAWDGFLNGLKSGEFGHHI